MVDIHPTPARPASTPEDTQSAVAIAEKVTGIAVPDGLDDLHPRVRAWIAEHKRLQKERELQNRRRGRNDWWVDPLLPDLTERDLYRFRVTSAIFKGVEKAGGRIEESPISGKVTFVIVNQKVECSIVEKLVGLSRHSRKSLGGRLFPTIIRTVSPHQAFCVYRSRRTWAQEHHNGLRPRRPRSAICFRISSADHGGRTDFGAEGARAARGGKRRRHAG